jgi:hypothetical protein
MSYDLRLDASTHDLSIVGGDLQLVDESLRVAQQIEVTLLFFLGEWFLNTDFGVPYFDVVYIKAPNWAAINAVLRARIIDVPGVTRVTRLDLLFDQARRALSVTFEAETIYGLTRPYNIGLSLRNT